MKAQTKRHRPNGTDQTAQTKLYVQTSWWTNGPWFCVTGNTWSRDHDHVSLWSRPAPSMATSICSASSEDTPPSCWNTPLNAALTLAGIWLAFLKQQRFSSGKIQKHTDEVIQPMKRQLVITWSSPSSSCAGRLDLLFLNNIQVPNTENRVKQTRVRSCWRVIGGQRLSSCGHCRTRGRHRSAGPDSPGDVEAATFISDQIPEERGVLRHPVLNVHLLLLRTNTRSEHRATADVWGGRCRGEVKRLSRFYAWIMFSDCPSLSQELWGICCKVGLKLELVGLKWLKVKGHCDLKTSCFTCWAGRPRNLSWSQFMFKWSYLIQILMFGAESR